MRFSRQKAISVTAGLCLFVVSLNMGEPAYGADPLQSFKALVARGQSHVEKAPPAVYFVESAGKWFKRKMHMVDVRYDVRKTDSLVSPFLGTIDFLCVAEVSEGFETRQEAEAATSLKDPSLPQRCHVDYAFQDGAWVFKRGEYVITMEVINKTFTLPVTALSRKFVRQKANFAVLLASWLRD